MWAITDEKWCRLTFFHSVIAGWVGASKNIFNIFGGPRNLRFRGMRKLHFCCSGKRAVFLQHAKNFIFRGCGTLKNLRFFMPAKTPFLRPRKSNFLRQRKMPCIFLLLCSANIEINKFRMFGKFIEF